MTATTTHHTVNPTGRRRRPAGAETFKARRISVLTAKYLSLVLAALCTFLPMIAILFASFKPAAEYAKTGALTPPSNWFNLDNFVRAFVDGGMLEGLVNTLIVLAVSLVATIFIGSMAAYAIDRFTFRGKTVVIALFMIATLVPSVTTQVATFQLINGLGLYDTKLALILLFSGTDIIAIYLFLQFMASIPPSLDEAAMLDGANRWTIYWRIILPLLKPAIATVTIIKGIGIYNEFYTPFLYLPSEGLISTTLFNFKSATNSAWEVIAAGTVLVIIPSLIAFLFLQKWIYKGLAAGAVK